ncbi:recombinase family protein [Chloroflexota bacterium]
MTCYSIAKQLNTLGVPTRYRKDKRGVRGKTTANLWRPGRVYNMLRNPTYKGEWTYGKRTKKRQPLLITVTSPTIVDAATFDKAQSRLKDNNLWSDRNAKRFYLLRGLVKCDLSGHSYSGYYSHSTRNGELRYYRCNRNGNRGNLLSEACESPSVPAKLLEDLVWGKIIDFVRNPETVKRMVANRLESTNEDNYRSDIHGDERRLEEFIEAEKRLLRLYADPKNKFSRDALDSQLEEIIQSRDLIKKRIIELTEAQLSEKEQRKRLENISFILGRLSQSVQNANNETKRFIIENLLLEVRVSKDTVGNPALRIVFAFEDNYSLSACYNDTDYGEQINQLHSARMPLRVLW